MRQLALPLARRSDPETSHRAASEAGALRLRHHRMILAAFRLEASTRLTSEQIADRTELDPVQVARRIKELLEAGRLVRTSLKRRNRSGRMAFAYREGG